MKRPTPVSPHPHSFLAVVDGCRSVVVGGDSSGAGKAFGLAQDPAGGGVPIEEWPAAVASLGVGIAPLADTKFNASKSWLKAAELSACGVPRSEERRVGTEWGSTCRSRWAQDH